MPALSLRLTLVAATLLTACATPPHGPSHAPSTRDEAFVPERWETVAVLPFTGDPAFRRPAGEFFASKMQKQPHFRIMTPGFAELVLKRNGQSLDATRITDEQAQKLGQLVDAQAVFIGNITLVRDGYVVYVRAEIKLIEVSQGHVVASVDRRPPISYSIDGYVLAQAAQNQAATEMMAILEALGKKAR